MNLLLTGYECKPVKSVSSQTCVTSDPLNDRINAEEYEMWRRSGSGPKELQNQIHLTLSATFPNLQVSTSKEMDIILTLK